MVRGFLAGSVSGLVVSALGLGTVSLVAEQPAGNAPPQPPEVTSPDLAAAAEAGDTQGVLPGVTADAGGAPQPSDTPGVSVQSADVPEVMADTLPLSQPDAGEVTGALIAPGAVVDPVVPTTDADPVLPSPQLAVPVVPESETDIVLDTTLPEPPAAPVVEAPQVADVPQGDAPEVVIIAPEDVAIAPDAEPVIDPDAIAEAIAPEVAVDEVVEDIVEDVDAAQDAAVEIAETVPEVVADAGPTAPVLVAPDVNEELPVTPGTDDAAAGAVTTFGTAATALPGAEGVLIFGRDAPVEEVAAVEEAAVVPTEGSALRAFAADIEPLGQQQILAVVLIDDGSLPNAGAALAELGFSVTVGLDLASEGAADRMAVYRAAGIEVIAIADVPVGARPSDAEVTYEAGFAMLNEAIGLLDLGTAGLQTDRDLAATAMARLAADGRGFVSLSQGLNGALRAAEDADVPAAAVYRDLDGNGQDARVIRRFLEQAAFRARQQGQVVLVGRVRADTLSALTLWNASNRDGQVVIGPVSTVLLAGQE